MNCHCAQNIKMHIIWISVLQNKNCLYCFFFNLKHFIHFCWNSSIFIMNCMIFLCLYALISIIFNELNVKCVNKGYLILQASVHIQALCCWVLSFKNSHPDIPETWLLNLPVKVEKGFCTNSKGLNHIPWTVHGN